MSEVLDLDALIPKELTVKLNGNEVKVKPPLTGDLLTLGNLSQAMDDISNDTPEQVDAKVASLTQHLTKMIPELSTTTLGLTQLQGLVAAFSAMAMPPNMKELAKKGIKTDTPKKAPKD